MHNWSSPLKTHSHENPFFSRNVSWLYHRVEIWKNINVYTLVKNHEKSIPCNQCTNTFLVACILTTHLRTHWCLFVCLFEWRHFPFNRSKEHQRLWIPACIRHWSSESRILIYPFPLNLTLIFSSASILTSTSEVNIFKKP